MKRLVVPSVALALAACNPGSPVTPGAHAPIVVAPDAPVEPAAPPAVVDAPPEDPDSFVAPDGMRTYYIVMLRRGPKWSAEQTPENLELGRGHMAYIGEQAKAGHLRVAGPFLGQTDPNDYAGIYIYDVGSLAQAQALVQKDPAVAAGRFVPEFLVWMAASGLTTDFDKKAAKAAADPRPPTCTGERHRDFDFWLGSWNVTNPKGEVVGTNRIEKAERGCALLEHWSSAKGGTGTSITYYDPARKVWLQTWVDGTGSVINLEGGLEEGAMRLGGTYTKLDGTSTLLRGAWTPLAGGKVRQLFEESKDGGLSWEPWFDGTYQRADS